MLRDRVVAAVVGLPIIWVVVHYGGMRRPEYWFGVPLLVLFCAVVIEAMAELYRAMPAKGVRPLPAIGYMAALVLLVGTWAPGEAGAFLFAAAWLIAIVGTLTVGVLEGRIDGAVSNVAATVFGFAYVGLLFSYFLRLRLMDIPLAMDRPDTWSFWRECGAAFLVVMATWLADSGAYFIGKAFGRRKLSPVISPGKTVAGGVGNILVAIATSVIIGALIHLSMVHSLIVGLIIGTVGQIGDLAESLLKRDLGIKDSSTIIPGHGGILDRCDALLFTMPAVYYYLAVFVAP